MNRLVPLAFLLALAVPAAAQVAEPRTNILYVDSTRGGAPETTRQLRVYVGAVRAEPGLVSAALLHEIGRDDRFAVYEVWKDEGALNAHLAGPGRKRLDGALAASIRAPIDERIGALVTPPGERAPVARLYVLTHIDVAPPASADATDWLKGQARSARAAPGFWGFELSRQPDHTNHFTVYQAWRDARAFADYSASQEARRVRDQLYRVKGALYDERLYRAD